LHSPPPYPPLTLNSRDTLEFLKERATKALFQHLSTKPEAEAQLLAALVNKLGDPSRKVASKAGYLLSQLLQQHPGMKVVVVREVSGRVLCRGEGGPYRGVLQGFGFSGNGQCSGRNKQPSRSD